MMDKAYRTQGEPDGDSAYLIWTTATPPPGPRHRDDSSIDQLASTLWKTPTPMTQASRHSATEPIRPARSIKYDQLQESE